MYCITFIVVNHIVIQQFNILVILISDKVILSGFH
jgi:hypothetical protein